MATEYANKCFELYKIEDPKLKSYIEKGIKKSRRCYYCNAKSKLFVSKKINREELKRGNMIVTCRRCIKFCKNADRNELIQISAAMHDNSYKYVNTFTRGAAPSYEEFCEINDDVDLEYLDNKEFIYFTKTQFCHFCKIKQNITVTKVNFNEAFHDNNCIPCCTFCVLLRGRLKYEKFTRYMVAIFENMRNPRNENKFSTFTKSVKLRDDEV